MEGHLRRSHQPTGSPPLLIPLGGTDAGRHHHGSPGDGLSSRTLAFLAGPVLPAQEETSGLSCLSRRRLMQMIVAESRPFRKRFHGRGEARTRAAVAGMIGAYRWGRVLSEPSFTRPQRPGGPSSWQHALFPDPLAQTGSHHGSAHLLGGDADSAPSRQAAGHHAQGQRGGRTWRRASTRLAPISVAFPSWMG